LQGGSGPVAQSSAPRQLSADEKRAAEFSSQVLATTEAVWGKVIPGQLGSDYRPPVMVLYSGVTQSPCGGASGATGPFYCPADRKAYPDTEFFDTLARHLGARGDFAATYVIAHQVAHHVQNELGILPEVNRRRQAAGQADANALTVRFERQGDCLSGVWARAVDGLLEPGDLKEALNAARMIGDDHLQKRAGQVPRPHTFTHGTSAQRAKWFQRGYDSGDLARCDTFGAARL
jgi:predicted metalloprotease